MFSIPISRRVTIQLLLCGISSVSALAINLDLLLVSPSSINSNNISTISDIIQGSSHTSTVSNSSLVSTNTTHLSSSPSNREIEWQCSDMLGTGPYTASCEDAARHIAFIPPGSDDSHVLPWGCRAWPTSWFVPLPQEVVSCKHLARTLLKRISKPNDLLLS